MPINEEGNEAKYSSRLKLEIFSYLDNNKSDRYDRQEIFEYFKNNFSDEPWGQFLKNFGSIPRIQDALKELVDEGKIEIIVTERDGSQYYKAK